MKKKTTNLFTTVFWISVVMTVCMSWAAVDSLDDDALTWVFVCGSVGLVAYMIERIQEES